MTISWGGPSAGRARYTTAVTSVMALLASLSLLAVGVVTGATPAASATQTCTPDAGFANCQRFTYSGVGQNFTVPAGVTSVGIKSWGAGGGGIDLNYYGNESGGGGGGFATGVATVTPGASLTVVVGQGGRAGSFNSTGTTYGGGGIGGTVTGGAANQNGSSGGGLSGVFSGTSPLIIAGAGGGASPGADTNAPTAGGGGGTTGGQDTQPALSGRGGTQTTGGAAGSNVGTCVPLGTAGSSQQGGTGGGSVVSGAEGGGGGGGGYFGGGGGRCQLAQSTPNGPGGGGSSYVGSAALTGGTTTNGSNGVFANPGTGGGSANTSDSQYVSGVGTGGGVVVGGANGGNGLVVIQWNAPAQLSLTKANPATLMVGAAAAYTLTVTNSSVTASTAATVVDKLPANVAYTSVSGTGWTCTASGQVSTGQTLTCTYAGSIAQSASSSFAVTVTPALAAGGTTVRNVAAVDPTGLANPVDPTTCTANDTPAGCAYPAAQTVQRSALTCEPGDLYVINSTDHGLYRVNPDTGAESEVGNVAAASGVTTNALAVTNGSGFAYSASGTGAAGGTLSIYRYDPSTDTTTTFVGPTMAATTSPSTVIAGAINPVNNLYYFGFTSGTGTATQLELYAFDTTTNTPVTGRIARINLGANISSGTAVNGDLAFDRLGRLFLVASTGDGSATANRLLSVNGVVGSTGSDAVYTAQTVATLNPLNSVFNGMAFDLPTGYLFVTGRVGTTSFIKKLNPSSGAELANYTLTAGTSIVIDAASCNYNNSLTGQANVVNRAGAGDQFTETISGGGLVVTPSGTTTGTDVGVQSDPAETAGPSVTAPGSTYTVTQTAAGTTSLGNYAVTWSCTNLLTGAVLASGTGNVATFLFPTPATHDGIPAGCVFTDTAFTLSLQKTNPVSLVAGQPSVYTFRVSNAGPSAAPGATVVDRLPANVAFTSATGAGWTCTATGTVAAGQTVTCTLVGTIAAGGVNTALAITVTPGAGTANTTVQNKAAVDPTGGTNPVDPSTCAANGNPAGCAVPAAQSIGTGITLSLTKSAPTPALVVGYPSTYTLTVTNSGVNPATSATVRDALPANTAYVSASGATCTASGSTTTGQTLLCTVTASIAAGGGTASFTVTLRPLAAASSVVNRASVDPTGGTSAVDPGTCTTNGSPAGCAVSPSAAAVADIVTGPSPSYTTSVGVAVASIDVKSATTSSQGKTIVNPTVATQPSSGTASVNSDGTLRYVPASGFSGRDTFTYTICDDGTPAACDTKTVTITVTNVFTPGPAVTTPQNTSVTTPLSSIATTTGKPLDPTRVTQTTAPAHGALSISPTTGAVTYTPVTGYSGSDSYQVQVCDTSSPVQCAVITKSVTVGANTVTAVNDSATTAPGTAVSINVRANDSSQTGQPLANPTVTAAPTQGTASVNADGTILYTPTSGKSGTDTFGYRVCDTSTPTPVCATATVTVSVPNTVTVVADSATTPQNTSVSIPLLANDTVSSGGAPLAPSSVTVTTAPAHGTVSVNTTTGAATYVPTAGYSGTDSFVYRVCDTSSPTPVCGSATVSLTVGANTVTAAPDSASTVPGAAVTTDVRANDTSSTGQPLAIPTVTSAPSKGTTSVDPTTGRITYTPTAGTSGTDTYVYRVCDTSTPTPVCASATVTVSVTNTVTAVDDTASTAQNTAVTTTVVANDTVSSSGAPLNKASVTVTTAPGHGSTSVNTTTGAVTYTPTTGYTGSDTYRYRVCDTSTPTPVCATANVTVTVGANTVTANDDSASTTPATAVTTTVRANDSSATGQPLANPTVVTQPGKGTATVNGNGTITYTPNSGTSGTDTYRYQVCDTSTPTPVCAQATVTVTVTNTVTATDDVDSTPQNSPKVTSVLANDTVSTGGAPLAPGSVTVTVAPAHGVTSVNTTTGDITYSPVAGYTGTDTYTYRVCDSSTPTAVCATAVVTMTVGANTVTAVNDTASTTPGTAVTTNVRANDTSATGQPLANPTVPTQPAKGTAVVNANGTITYTPTSATSGTDTYTYRVCDTSTPTPVCSQATVTVTVTNTVTANPDTASTGQNTSVAMSVLTNDTVSPNGAPLAPGTVAVTTAPAHGSTSVNTSTGVVTYTPAAGYTGTDTYRYQVCDTSTPTAVCASALATVTVGANTVTAVNDSATTTPGTGVGIDVRANDTSGTGQPLANPTVTTPPTKGTATVTAASGRIIYTPTNGTSGTDTFTYRVCDTSTPTPVCASATVTVTVVNVVTANADAGSTPQNTPVTTAVLSNDTVSTNGSPLNPASVSVVTAAAHGTTTVSSSTGAVTYTPATGYSGTDTYQYQVCDSSTPTPVCATATVTLTVGGNSVTASNDTATTTPVTPVTTDVRANDTSSTGQPFANPTVTTAPTKGTTAVNANGTITYTPTSGTSGTDVYTYQVCDTSSPTPVCGSATVTVTVTNTVTAVRDTLSVAQNTAGTADVLANDTVTTGGAPLNRGSVTIVSPVSHGTTSINPTTGAITYTPAAGYSGSDVLTYQVCDSSTTATGTPQPTCSRITLVITVGANTVTAVDDTASTTPGVAVSTNVRANDTSSTGQALAAPTVTTQPSKGTASVNADGTIAYTPTAGTSGTDTYRYQVCDTSTPTPVCSSATVTVSVPNVVTATNDSATTPQNTTVGVNVLANDRVSTNGSPLDPASVAVTTAAGHGTTSVNTTTGAITYVPATGFSGTDSFVYQVCDRSTPTRVCASATVTVTVGTNTVTAINDTATTQPATSVVVAVRANDSSASGQPLANPVVISSPAKGTASVNADGTITYSPTTGTSGTDSFAYRVCDTSTVPVCANATVTITVPNTVTANPDTATTAQNTAVTTNVLTNDTVTAGGAPLSPASVTVSSAPAHGMTSVNATTGAITYTPARGYTGTDGYSYQVCDTSTPTATCSTTTVSVTVGANTVTASPDSATTQPITAVDIDVRANDSSSTGQALANPTVTTAAAHGSTAVNATTGVVTYTPQSGFSGQDSFVYRVCDTSTPTPVCASATVTVTVPDTVRATDDAATTPQNTSVTTSVLANDTVTSGAAPLSPSSVSVVTAPTHGSTSVSSTTGAVTYTPVTGYSGTDTYSYRVCDTSTPTPVCATATVTVTVGANTVTAVNDTATTTPVTPVTTDVRANDTSSTGQPLANPTVTTQGTKGTATVGSNGAITYRPNTGTSGVDTYTYRVCDTSSPTPVCATATVTVTVSNTVTAVADSAATAQNTAVTTDVLSNDTVSAGGSALDPSSVVVSAAPAHGTTSVSSVTGAVTYTPTTGYSGNDSYGYRVCDGSTPTPVCSSTTVTVSVGANVVRATDDTDNTTPGTPVQTAVLANDSSSTGQPLANPTVTTQPTKGTVVVNADGTITYTPTGGTSGVDSYRYQVCDTSTPTPVCATATVTITVSNTVRAVADSATTPQNTTVSVPVLANDSVATSGAPLDPASVTVTTAPAHGTAVVETATGAVRYTPTAGYSGTDTFGYRVCDSSTPTPTCATAQVTVTVSPNTVTAVDDTATTTPGNPVSTNVRANDTSASGLPLANPTIVGQPAKGTVTVGADGSVTYTPPSGTSGGDSYRYQVCDTSTPTPVCATATVAVSVTNTLTVRPDSVSTGQNVAVSTPVLTNDGVSTGGAPLDPSSVRVTVAPTHGTTAVNTSSGAVTYTPAPGYSGPDSYTYRVCDTSTPTPVCGNAVVSVTVGGNSVSANPDSYSTPPGTAVTADVRSNDSSASGQSLAAPTITTNPGKGTVVVNADGTVTYTPTSGTSGTDTFVYQVCDTGTTPSCALARVTVAVTNTVTATPDASTVAQNGSVTTAILSNDTVSPGGAPLRPGSVTIATPAAHGTTSIDPSTGAVTYTPTAGYSGPDGYTYRVCDSSTPTAVCDSTSVTITVSGNTVTAAPDDITTTPGVPVTADVRANDTSASGQPLAAPTIVAQPTKGTAVVNADGTITYSPAAGESGTDSFTYQVCDTGTPAACSTTVARATLSVVNTVSANDDAASTAQNTAVTSTVLANDTVSAGGSPLDPASVLVTTPPLHGATSVGTDGRITYTPALGFSGSDSYVYRVCDGSTPTPVCDTATVSVSVGTNTVSAGNDSATTTPGNPVTTVVRANDSSATGQPLATPTIVTPPTKGSAVVNPDGSITYTPADGTSGTDTYVYQVCDTSSTPVCGQAGVTVSVVNTVTARPDSATVAQNGTVVVPVLGNDATGAHGAALDPSSVAVTTAAAHGATTVNTTTGAVTYQPATGYSGSDSFVYRVCDQSTPTAVCSSATVTLTVGANAVSASPDSAQTTPGQAVTTDVRANDTSSSGQPLAVPTIVTQPTKGAVRVNADGTITYTPTSGTSGTDSYVYQVCDTSTTPVCATAGVTVMVTNTVRAASDASSTAQNVPVTTAVLANDSVSPAGAPLDPASVTVTGAPVHGTTVVTTQGEVTYTPDAGFSGTDTYTYTVCDRSTPTTVCDSAVVTVSVGGNTVSASDDTAATTPGVAVTTDVRANDTSTSGQPLALPTVVTQPSKGTATVGTDGRITYTPRAGTSGDDQYTYQVCDTGRPAACGTATVAVTVTNTVTAAPDSATVPQNGSVSTPVLSNDTVSPGGSPLNAASVTVQTAPAHGQTSVNTSSGSITYTPTAGYSGADSYTYSVCDGSTPAPVCATATVSVTVAANTVEARDDATTTSPGTAVTIAVLANDTSSSGQPLGTPTITSQPTKGTVAVDPSTGTVTYTPTPGTSGTELVTYRVCDTGTPPSCDSATITFFVNNTVNAEPDTVATGQNVAVTTPVLDNDTVSPQGAPLDPTSVTVTAPPAHGTTTVNATGTITYTPTPGYSGSDSYTYTVCDTSTPAPVCNDALVSVTVGADAIAVNADSATVVPGSSTRIDVLANDSTGSGQPFGAPTVTAGPSHGTATVNADGTITYTPTAGTSGQDSFTYQVCDTGTPPACGSAVVTVTVATTVTAAPDSATVAQNGTVTVPVLDNDTVTPGAAPLNPASLTVVGVPAHGTATVVNGQVNYQPTRGYSGPDSFTYQVCDTSSPTPSCATGTVTVSVSANTLTVTPDAASTTPGQPVTIDVRRNDVSASGQPLALPTIVTPPGKGTATVNSTGTVTYTPASGTSGTDTFTYQVCDTGVPAVCGSATVTVQVASTVTVRPDTAAVAPGGSVTTAVLANDTVSPGGAPLDPASETIVAAPAHGTAVVDPTTGAVTYTPETGFEGTDSYTYQVCDSSSPTPVCGSATVTVTVSNGVVVAGSDSATGPAGSALTIDVRANDSSTTGHALGAPTIATAPQHGTAVVNADGTITYTPTPGTSGTDTFTYRICDTSNPPVCSTGTVTVESANAVTANPDASATAYGTAVTTAVLSNDTVSPGGAPLDPTSVTVVGAPAHGTTSVDGATGAITYTPASGFSGQDTYSYQVCDTSTPTPVCSTTTVTVTVAAAGVPAQVTARDDAASTRFDTSVTTDVLANDSVLPGEAPLDPASVRVTVAAGHGTTSVNPTTGAITYTPAAGFQGSDSYTYEVCDQTTPTPYCDTAVVTVTVGGAPTVTAVDDVATTSPGKAVAIDVRANDSSSTGGPLARPTLVRAPTKGTVVVGSDGRMTYTPKAGTSGVDTFTYRVCDVPSLRPAAVSRGVASPRAAAAATPVCDTATVTVSVVDVVTAGNDRATTGSGQPVTIAVLGNDGTLPSAAPLDPGSVVVTSAPRHGTTSVNRTTGAVTYSPVAGFAGTDTFTYRVCDTSTPTPVCTTAVATVVVTAPVSPTPPPSSPGSPMPKTGAAIGGILGLALVLLLLGAWFVGSGRRLRTKGKQ